MTIELYIAILLTILVVGMVGTAVFLSMTLIQVRRAAQALERLSERFGDNMTRVGEVMGTVGHAVVAATGGLGRGAAVGAGILYAIIDHFRKKKKKTDDVSSKED